LPVCNAVVVALVVDTGAVVEPFVEVGAMVGLFVAAGRGVDSEVPDGAAEVSATETTVPAWYCVVYDGPAGIVAP
jgi:hypothetical protein